MNQLSLIGTIAEDATMNSVEIESMTGSRHDSVKRTIERLAESGVISLPPLVEVKVQRERRAESVDAYVFSGIKGRRDSIVVVAQLCPEFTARIVDRWQELETGKATTKAPMPHAVPVSREELELRLVSMAADCLRVSPSGKLGMITGFMQLRAPDMVPLLPVYAINAPSTSTIGGSAPTMSATSLLKTNGVSIGAAKLNAILLGCGMIEQLTRPSASQGTKTFWSVTTKGESYGKNVTNSKNQRETQPHWYVAKFAELLEVAGVAK